MARVAMIVACLVALSIISGAAGQARADGGDPVVVWMWVDRHGTLGFTDDVKRIPSVYRATAGRKPIEWPRVTVDHVGSDKRREALRARLETLRAAPPASCGCASSD